VPWQVWQRLLAHEPDAFAGGAIPQFAIPPMLRRINTPSYQMQIKKFKSR